MRLGVLGIDPQGLLVVVDGFLDPARLLQRDRQIVVDLVLIRLGPQGLVIVRDGVADPALLQEDMAQIAMRLDGIGLDPQGLFILRDSVADFPRLHEEIAQAVVRHPTPWVFRDGIPPKGFRILVNARLSPRQNSQRGQHGSDRDCDNASTFAKAMADKSACAIRLRQGYGGHDGGQAAAHQRNDPDAGEILKVVGDKGEPKRIIY